MDNEAVGLHGLCCLTMSGVVVTIQNLLPQPYLARAFGGLARSRRPWLRRFLIRLWMRLFDISLNEAARTHPEEYDSFEDFFTRELRPGVRPQPEDEDVVSAPADGFLQTCGTVQGGDLIQAKGIHYPLGSLLGDYRLAGRFDGGWYATIYLSPGDYHRLHAPCDMSLRSVITIPGQAYSVTRGTSVGLPGLFCRNERMTCVFESRSGRFALVMVGAMLVTGIETVWRPGEPIRRLESVEHTQDFRRGEEFGRFTLGSTVVLIFPAGVFDPSPGLNPGQPLRVGEPLGINLNR